MFCCGIIIRMAGDDTKSEGGIAVPSGGCGDGQPKKLMGGCCRPDGRHDVICAGDAQSANGPGREGPRTLPKTSTTLLRDLASGSDHARWADFVARYRPMMESFMQRRFPDLESEDAIQETLMALMDALPTYRYVPGETGHFHNYLTGILWHKALNMRRAKRRREDNHERYRNDMAASVAGDAADETRERRNAILEIALQQLLADDSILERNRLIFRRVAIDGDSPAAVAEAFGVTRTVVDQTKKRLTDRLRALVKMLEQIDG